MSTNFYQVRRSIRNGDMFVFRNGGAIGAEGRNPASHIGRAVWVFDTLLCAESREFYGGRCRPVSGSVRRYPGRIDVYRPKCSHQLRERMAEIAVRQTDIEYSYAGIWRASLNHMPVVRWALRKAGVHVDTHYTDMTPSKWDEPKFCSWFSIFVDRYAARGLGEAFDPVPNLAERFTEPADLVRSSSYVKVFEGLTL